MQDGRDHVIADFSAGVGFDGDLVGGDTKRLTDTKLARQIVNLGTTGAGSLRGRRGCSQLSGSGTNYAGKRLAALDNGPSGIPFILDFAGATAGRTPLNTGTRVAFGAGYLPANGLGAWVQAPLSGDGQGPLFMQNGIDTPWYWSGSGNMVAWTKNVAAVNAIPKGGIMAYAANRVWIAGDPNQPSRLYWSSLTATGGCDPGNFDTTPPSDGGFADLAPNDGQAITAIVPFGGYVLVFKEHKIFLLYDPAAGAANRMVTDQYGLAGLYYQGGIGAVATPYGVVFLADAGSLAGGSQPYFRPFITDGNSVRALGRLPLSPVFTASGAGIIKLIYFENKLYIGGGVDLAAASGGPLVGATVEYNFELDSWWLHQIATAGATPEGINDAIAVRAFDTRTVRLWANGSTSGKLFKLFDNDVDGLDNGNGYAWKYVSPWYTLGSRTKRKRVDAIVLEPQAGSAVVESQVDLFGSWAVLGGSATPTAFQTRYYTPVGSTGQGGGVLWSARVSGVVTSGRPNLAALAFEFGKRSD